MSTENPYAPPLLPAEEVSYEWPSGGVFRDGPLMIMHHTAGLPMVCLKTDKRADAIESVELRVVLSSDRSVSPSRWSFWWQNPVHRLNLPLSSEWLDLRRRWLRRGKVVALIGLAVLVGGFGSLLAMRWTLLTPFQHQWLLMATAITGGVLAAVGVLIRDVWKPVLQLHYVAGGYFWLSGVCQSYVQTLPSWPVPPPSPWQQLIHWTSGPIAPKVPALKESESS